MGGKYCDQIARKGVHSLGAVADVVLMLKARGGDVKMKTPEIRAVLRRVPGLFVCLAPC